MITDERTFILFVGLFACLFLGLIGWAVYIDHDMLVRCQQAGGVWANRICLKGEVIPLP